MLQAINEDLNNTYKLAKFGHLRDKNMITEWSIVISKLIGIVQTILKIYVYLKYMCCAVGYSRTDILFSPYIILLTKKVIQNIEVI